MSIAVGRFLPGVRAVVPLVAGMVGMPPLRFYVFNVASALAWSPAHILPAAFAGAALGGLGAISGRLVVAVVVIALLALVLLWALRAAFFVSLRFAGAAQVRLAAWAAARNTKVSRTVARILSPIMPTSVSSASLPLP